MFLLVSKRLAFRFFYRLPGPGHTSFRVLRDIIASHACDTLILGDEFCLPGLSKLDGNVVVLAKAGYREFTFFVNSLNFKKYVNSPTRDGNPLDLLVYNTANIIRNTKVSPGISAHGVVYVDLFIPKTFRQPCQRKAYVLIRIIMLRCRSS